MRAIGYVTAAVLILLVLVAVFASISRPRSPITERDTRGVPANVASEIAQSATTPIPEILQTTMPVNNEVIFDVYPKSTSKCELKVINGASRNAVAKLIDLQTDKKILSFAICAGMESKVSAIPDGSYRLMFAFGDRVYVGTLNFESPVGFWEFDRPFTFPPTSTSAGWNVTLTPVADGNITRSTISRGEFEKY